MEWRVLRFPYVKRTWSITIFRKTTEKLWWESSANATCSNLLSNSCLNLTRGLKNYRRKPSNCTHGNGYRSGSIAILFLRVYSYLCLLLYIFVSLVRTFKRLPINRRDILIFCLLTIWKNAFLGCFPSDSHLLYLRFLSTLSGHLSKRLYNFSLN